MKLIDSADDARDDAGDGGVEGVPGLAKGRPCMPDGPAKFRGKYCSTICDISGRERFKNITTAAQASLYSDF